MTDIEFFLSKIYTVKTGNGACYTAYCPYPACGHESEVNILKSADIARAVSKNNILIHAAKKHPDLGLELKPE